MVDSFTFEGEEQDDISAPRACETKGTKHCPFTGELIVAVEQKEFEPNFEAEFLEFIRTNNLIIAVVFEDDFEEDDDMDLMDKVSVK